MKTEDTLRTPSKRASQQTISRPAREVAKEKRVLPGIKLNGVSIKLPKGKQESGSTPAGEDLRRKKRPARHQLTTPPAAGPGIVVVTEEGSGEYGWRLDNTPLAVVGHSQQQKKAGGGEDRKTRERIKTLPVDSFRCPMKPDGTAIQPLPPIQGNKAVILHATKTSPVLTDRNKRLGSPGVLPVRHTKKSAQMLDIMLTKKVEDQKREAEELAKQVTPRENDASRSTSKASARSAKVRPAKASRIQKPPSLPSTSKVHAIISVPSDEIDTVGMGTAADDNVLPKYIGDTAYLPNNRDTDGQLGEPEKILDECGGKKDVGDGDIEVCEHVFKKVDELNAPINKSPRSASSDGKMPGSGKQNDCQFASKVEHITTGCFDPTEEPVTKSDITEGAVIESVMEDNPVTQQLPMIHEEVYNDKEVLKIHTSKDYDGGKSCNGADQNSGTEKGLPNDNGATYSSMNEQASNKTELDENTPTNNVQSNGHNDRRKSSNERKRQSNNGVNERHAGTKVRLVQARAIVSAKSVGKAMSPRKSQVAFAVGKHRLVQSARNYNYHLDTNGTALKDRKSKSANSLLDKHADTSSTQKKGASSYDKNNGKVRGSEPIPSKSHENESFRTSSTSSGVFHEMDRRSKKERDRLMNDEKSRIGDVIRQTHKDLPPTTSAQRNDNNVSPTHACLWKEPKPPPNYNEDQPKQIPKCYPVQADNSAQIDGGNSDPTFMRTTSRITSGLSVGHTPYPFPPRGSSTCSTHTAVSSGQSDGSTATTIHHRARLGSEQTTTYTNTSSVSLGRVSNSGFSARVDSSASRSSSQECMKSAHAIDNPTPDPIAGSRRYSNRTESPVPRKAPTPPLVPKNDNHMFKSRLPVPQRRFEETRKHPPIVGYRPDDTLIRTASWITNGSSVGQIPHPCPLMETPKCSAPISVSTAKSKGSTVTTARRDPNLSDGPTPAFPTSKVSVSRNSSGKFSVKTTTVSDKNSRGSAGSSSTPRSYITVVSVNSMKMSINTVRTAASNTSTRTECLSSENKPPCKPISRVSSQLSSRNSWESSTASSTSRILSGRRTYIIPVSPSEYRKILPLPTIHGTTPDNVTPEPNHQMSPSIGPAVRRIDETPITGTPNSKQSNLKSVASSVASSTRTIATPYTWPMTRDRLEEYFETPVTADEDDDNDGSRSPSAYTEAGGSRVSLIDDIQVFMSPTSSCGTSSVELDLPMSPGCSISETTVVLAPACGNVYKKTGD